MTIETAIEWYLNGPTWQVFLVALPLALAIVASCRALWRWVARRRKDKELGIVRRKGFVFFCGSKPDCAPPVYSWTPLDEPDPKPAPDHKYQGDQVTSLRKELLALEERVAGVEKWIAAELGNAFAQGVKEERAKLLAQPARHRVFRDGNVFCAVCADGIEVAWRGRSGIWRVPVLPWVAGQFERSTSHAELAQDSPEYREIVASFEAWKGGQ